MLNTTSWTQSAGRASALDASSLMLDFEEADPVAVATAINVTKSAHPEKPYVYGENRQRANALRDIWNLLHPFDPMP